MDQKSELVCLRNEVERMSEMEGECARKEDLIEQLREEVANLQNFVRHIEVDRCPMCQQNSAAGNTANTGTTSALTQASPPVLRHIFSIRLAVGPILSWGTIQREPVGPCPTRYFDFGWVGHNAFGHANNWPVCYVVHQVNIFCCHVPGPIKLDVISRHAEKCYVFVLSVIQKILQYFYHPSLYPFQDDWVTH